MLHCHDHCYMAPGICDHIFAIAQTESRYTDCEMGYEESQSYALRPYVWSLDYSAAISFLSGIDWSSLDRKDLDADGELSRSLPLWVPILDGEGPGQALPSGIEGRSVEEEAGWADWGSRISAVDLAPREELD